MLKATFKWIALGVAAVVAGVLLNVSITGAQTQPGILPYVQTYQQATSTFAWGINLSGGCFSVAGVCIGSGSSFSTTSADHWLTTKTTSNLAEGVNEYFTQTKARNAISETITGIDYNALTGDFSLSTGYEIPKTASTTDWQTAFGWGDHGLAGYITSSSLTPYFTLVSWYATTTDALDEGDINRYYTDARVGTYISGSSTVPHVGGSAWGDLLYWTGTGWLTRATSTLGVSWNDVQNIPAGFADGVDNTGGAPAWGTITGTPSDQTDLWAILDPKLSSTTLALFDKGFFHSTTSADYWETQQTARTADDLSNNTTTDLPEGTNLYFTVARVLSALTGQHVQSQYFTATGTTASVLPYASSTGISATTFWGALIGNVTGNISGTAGSLAANGANCSAGNAPLGVDQAGAVESCFDVWTEAENTSAAYITASALSPYLTLAGFYATTSHDMLSKLTGLGNIGSSTATTTIAGGLKIDTLGLQVDSLNAASCDLKATTEGVFYCGTDATGASGGAYPFTPTSYNGEVTSATSSPVRITGNLYASSTTRLATTTTYTLNGVIYADQMPGADIGAKINNAYAFLPTHGGTIVVPTGFYSFSTAINLSTAGKRALIQCANASSTTLFYTGSGTSTTIDWGGGNVGSQDHEFGSGIDGCTFRGSDDTFDTSVGVVLGGTNGAEGVRITNSRITNFQKGLVVRDNTWNTSVHSSLLNASGRNFVFEATTNAGENLSFVSTVFADNYNAAASTSVYIKCVDLSKGGVGVSFVNSAFDDCQVYAGNASTLSFTNPHFENPAGDGAGNKYTPIYIEPSEYTNVSIQGGLWVQGATAQKPDSFIYNGGHLTVNGFTARDSGGGVVNYFVVNNNTNSGGNVSITGLTNDGGSAFTDVSPKDPTGFDPTADGSRFIESYIQTKDSYPFITKVTDASVLHLYTGNTEAMVINASGNVGFGTTTPQYALQLYRANGTNADFCVTQGTFTQYCIKAQDSQIRHTYGDPVYWDSDEAGTTRMALLTDGKLGIGTSSPYAALSIVGSTGVVAEKYTATGTATSTFAGPVQSSAFGIAGTWFVNATQFVLNSIAATFNAGVTVLDFLDIPSGANPTVDAEGESALDTTDNQFLVGDSGGTAFVAGRKVQRIWSVTVASTSRAFIDGGLLPVPSELDGYTMTAIRCKVDDGTSKVVAVEDASANSTEDITCATTVTSDDGSITNAAATAEEEMYIDFGATSGAVNYVTISVFGTLTRE